MPELPEVETVRVGLSRLVIGKTIAAVSHDTEKSFPNAEVDVAEFVIGSKILGIRRRAKVLIIDLSTNYSLVTHLKMTGQLVFIGPTNKNSRESRVVSPEQKNIGPRDSRLKARDSNTPVRFGAGHPNRSLIGDLPDKTTRVIFEFADGSHLFFNDQRKFGWIRLIPTPEVENIDFFKKVGPEPLADDFSAKDFAERLMRRKNTNIKAALLDQTVIAGVGNIYADESLWGAKIHPETRVGILSKEKLKTLYEKLRYVMQLSIEKGGSTDKNFVDAKGKRGSYLKFARVFRREGQPCPRCRTTIIKKRVAGRGTHLCPHCQKL